MNINFVFTFVILSCLPDLLHSAMSTCPKRFSCQDTPFKYPFYNATNKGCGLIKVSCISNHTKEIQLGKHSYAILPKVDYASSVTIYNKTFEKLVNETSCEALMNNFTSPRPLLYSISINPFITLFKCRKKLNYSTDETGAYFHQPNYYSYNSCKDHNFYYKLSVSNRAVPSDLPHACQVIQLPVVVAWNHSAFNPTNIFSLISPFFSISIQLSTFCSRCNNKGGQCDTYNGHFQCLHPKKGRGRRWGDLCCSDRWRISGVVVEAKQTFLTWYLNNSHFVAAVRNLPWVKLLLALGVGVAIILISIILCLKRKFGWRKKTEFNANVEIFLKNQAFMAPKRFSYSQIKKMTNTFKVKLGQGGFGSVYRGELSNGNLVAVKVLSQLKGDGKDFVNEVASVGRTSHVNIVSLVGFCLEGRQRALIYEFMHNGSLDKFIYGRGPSSNSHLGWEKLHQIAIGIARGLEYLHSGCNTRILHFDIKPHNILLDQDLCPKITDFGLAKLFPNERSKISMSHMRGTPDVCGRKDIGVEVDHSSEMYFPHWIYKRIEFNEEQLGLHGIVSDEENNMIRKTIIVGLWCIQTNPLNRPTITRVLEMLEDDLASIEIPPKPYMSSPPRSVGSPSTD
ncbi:putative glycerophosphodiester phosphodiesterase [Tanacetum coccineum]